MSEVNFKSSTIEKGLELAKEFLGKLISPTIEELGLLISDNVKFLRFKNQVKILLKAKKYVDEKNISIKEIPIKILVPLLEKASLEENESLQDKWASMIANMVDTTKNLENQIFPFLLGQISIEEFNELKILLLKEQQFIVDSMALNNARTYFPDAETRKLREKVNYIDQRGFELSLTEVEKANLLRLGLIKQLPPSIYISEFKTGESSGEKWHSLEAEYNQSDYGFRISELGKKFIEICEVDNEEIPNSKIN